jgi:hypothetical protein
MPAKLFLCELMSMNMSDDEGEGQCRKELERLGHWGDTSEERENSRSERMKKMTARVQESSTEARQDHKDQPITQAPQRRPPPPPTTSLTRNRRMKKLEQLLKEGEFFSREFLYAKCFVPPTRSWHASLLCASLILSLMI